MALFNSSRLISPRFSIKFQLNLQKVQEEASDYIKISTNLCCYSTFSRNRYQYKHIQEEGIKTFGDGICSYYKLSPARSSLSIQHKTLSSATQHFSHYNQYNSFHHIQNENCSVSKLYRNLSSISSSNGPKSKETNKYKAKEDIKTIPNLLTALRMCSSPVLAYLVLNEQFSLALGLFTIAGLTDMLDGYIARNFKNQRTAFGTALDPLADKVLMSFLTVSLTCASLIPVPLTALILCRDAGLIVCGVYIRYTSLEAPRTLTRYFDPSLVTVKVYPSLISKINTGFQFTFVAMALASGVFDFVGHPMMQAFMYTTAATTFLSGADYALTWRKRLKIVKDS